MFQVVLLLNRLDSIVTSVSVQTTMNVLQINAYYSSAPLLVKRQVLQVFI